MGEGGEKSQLGGGSSLPVSVGGPEPQSWDVYLVWSLLASVMAGFCWSFFFVLTTRQDDVGSGGALWVGCWRQPLVWSVQGNGRRNHRLLREAMANAQWRSWSSFVHFCGYL